MIINKKNTFPDERDYLDKLKDSRWIRARALILRRDDYTCQNCGGKHEWGYTLQVHHKKYHGSNPWDSPPNDLITLCRKCHEDAHNIAHVDNYEKRTKVGFRLNNIFGRKL